MKKEDTVWRGNVRFQGCFNCKTKMPEVMLRKIKGKKYCSVCVKELFKKCDSCKQLKIKEILESFYDHDDAGEEYVENLCPSCRKRRCVYPWNDMPEEEERKDFHQKMQAAVNLTSI